MLARARPEVDHPVGRAHHLLVVLDDEDGVADVAELLERVDEPSVVALVQPDRRLVEDVEDADELRPDLCRQPQPLSLAARQRLRRPVELEVADADVLEEHQPLAHLLEDAPTDELLGLRQLELVDEPERTCNRHLREPVDREIADRHGEHLRLEPRAVALGARSEAHVLLDAVTRVRRVRLAVAPLQVVEETLERHRVLALPAHPVAVRDEDLLCPRPVQEPILLLGRELAPRHVERDLVALRDRLDHRVVEALAPDRPRDERTLLDRERRIGNEEIGVDLELRAEPGAAGTCSVRRVEREHARLELGQRDAVIGAREVLGEGELVSVDDVDDHEPLGERRRRLDGLREPLPEIGLHREPVDDDLDRVLELLVEDDLLLEEPQLAVDLHARESVAAQLLQDVLELALAVAHDRRVHREPRAFVEAQHLLDDLVERLPRDRPPADRAVRPADARIQQPQVVVDLRDRPDRRARVARGRLLVDGDRRREPVDRVDVGLLHHLQELARVCGERLDVAALTLRVDRVERERGLPGAREAGHAHERVPRNADGDVLQVVLAGAVDDELFGLAHRRVILPSRTDVR